MPPHRSHTSLTRSFAERSKLPAPTPGPGRRHQGLHSKPVLLKAQALTKVLHGAICFHRPDLIDRRSWPGRRRVGSARTATPRTPCTCRRRRGGRPKGRASSGPVRR
jgi:hypothetical protein